MRPRTCQVWGRIIGLVGVLGILAALWFVVAEGLHLDELRRFHAVRLGMTEDEVLAVLGKPPGQYGPPAARYGHAMWLA